MKTAFAICYVLLIIGIYMNPKRTATIQLHDGTITTATVSGLLREVSIHGTYPMYKVLGENIIGTGDELATTEQVQIIKVESMW